MRPNRIAPASAQSSLAPRETVSHPAQALNRGVGELILPSYRDYVIQRKRALRAGAAKCGLSREQIADRLREMSGEQVTVKTIDHWLSLSPEDMRRRMPAEMHPYWIAVTGCRLGIDELLDELELTTVPEIHAEIAAHVCARHQADEGLANALRRAV